MLSTDSQGARRAFSITSFGNGLVFEITRLADDACVLLQGDDALTMLRALDGTGKSVTEDDIAASYFD